MGDISIFMRLTPDSRAPAKADPWKVCVGCNPCPCSGVVVVVVVVVVFFVVVVVVVVVGRCWPMLALFGRRFAPVLALGCGCCCCCRGRRCFLLLLLVLVLLLLWLSLSPLFLLLLADVSPIWAQVCPCLGPRLAHVAHILA